MSARAAYAAARLQARAATRPTAALAAALDAGRSVEHRLAALRALAGGPAGAWLRVPDGLEARDPDAIERWLVAAWREGCAEFAQWQPPAWRAAIAACALLPDLATLERLRARRDAPERERADPWLAPVARAAPEARATALAGTPHAALAPAWRTGTPLRDAWRQAWQATWPPTDDSTRAGLRALAGAAGAAARLGRVERRAALERVAERVRRRHASTAAAAFATLLLRALDLERVRGALAAPGAAP